jgi:chromate reductase
MKILTLIGSTSEGSLNRKLFEFVKDLAPKEFEFVDFDISKIPFYSQEAEEKLPEIITKLKKEVVGADGVMVISPEHNRSLPAVLKNAIDWASRPYIDNSWSTKCVCILGASPSAIGTFGAQVEIRRVLAFLNAFVMQSPEMYFSFGANINDKGQLTERAKKSITKFLEAFKDWIISHK